MSHDRRRAFRISVSCALGAGAALAVSSAALTAPQMGHAPAEELLRIHSDEPLVLRFGSSVRASRISAKSIHVARESDGVAARGRYLPGTFLIDPATGGAVAVDREAYIQAEQVIRGLDRAAATQLVDRTLSRYAQSGRPRDFEPLRFVIRALDDAMGGVPGYQPELGASGGGQRLLPLQDPSAPEAARALRTLQAGDDTLWEAYVLGNDVSAFNALAQDPNAARFHHFVDPQTGQPNALSDFRFRIDRRFLFTSGRTGHVYTFVPDVPVTPQLTDAAFTANDRYAMTLSPALPIPLGGILTTSGFRAALHHRIAHLETTNPNHDTSSGDVYGAPVDGPQFGLSELHAPALRILDVTPPNGERLVDPSTDWENPDNRFTVPRPLRTPFVARLRFNQPLDPRTVSSTTFTMTQRSASGGTPEGRLVNMPVPADVRLVQNRLGDVEVEIAPRVSLDPSAQYEIAARNLVKTLDGRASATDFLSTFTTAPLEDRPLEFFEEFTTPAGQWTEADTPNPRALVAADTAHDPGGAGLFVPFLGNDPKPVSAIESHWLDSRAMAPVYSLNFDDPATPPIDGSTIVHAPPGSSVRIFARTTITDLATDDLNLSFVGPWTELTPPIGKLPGARFVQLRIEFTVPADATPATTDLPYVEQLDLIGSRP